jgi:hypothetical protein
LRRSGENNITFVVFNQARKLGDELRRVFAIAVQGDDYIAFSSADAGGAAPARSRMAPV